MNLDKLIDELRLARNELASEIEYKRLTEEEISQTVLGKRAQESNLAIATLKEKTQEIEEKIRNLVKWQYEDDGNKRPHQKVEVKIFNVVEITDEREAVAWASKNDPSAITLNVKKFTSDVKNLDLPFLSKREEPRVQIASDLDKND